MSQDLNCGMCHKKPGAHYPIICMWARGYPAGSHDPLRMFAGTTVCDDCKATTEAQNFLLPEGRQKIEAALMMARRAPPDFDNAWLEWGVVGDQEWMTTAAVFNGSAPSKH